MRVLAIETSCDETAVAVYGSGEGLAAHRVYTQTDLHEVWGGVVPEVYCPRKIDRTTRASLPRQRSARRSVLVRVSMSPIAALARY